MTRICAPLRGFLRLAAPVATAFAAAAIITVATLATTPAVAQTTPNSVNHPNPSVCARTPQIRDAIVQAIHGSTANGASLCSSVTIAQMTALTNISDQPNGQGLHSQNITLVRAGDFNNLPNITYLHLDSNPLVSILGSANGSFAARDVFAGLDSVTWLDLDSNQLLTSLPTGSLDDILDTLARLHSSDPLKSIYSITPTPATAYNGQDITIPVSLSHPAPVDVNIPWTALGPNASSGGGITIPAGATSGNIVVPAAHTNNGTPGTITVTLNDVSDVSITGTRSPHYTNSVDAVVGGIVGRGSSFTHSVTVRPGIANPSICSRTPQVRDWIVNNTVGGTPSVTCGNVTLAQMLSLSGNMQLHNRGLTSLRVGDLNDLPSLTNFHPDVNPGLRSLPNGILDGLDSLVDFEIDGTGITSLPAGILDDVLDTLTHFYAGGLIEGAINFATSVTDVNVSLSTSADVAVTVSKAPPTNVLIPYTVAGLPSNTGGVLTIPAGSTTANITLSGLDSVPDGSTISVSLGTVAGITLQSTTNPAITNTVATIIDDLISGVTTSAHTIRVTYPPNPSVCNRTPQIRDWIVARTVGGTPSVTCGNVTLAQMAGFRGSLQIHHTGLTSLSVGDFNDLPNLTALHPDANTGLTSLPAGIFDGLDSLTDLDIDQTSLTELPVGVLDDILDTLTVIWTDPPLKRVVQFADATDVFAPISGQNGNIRLMLDDTLPADLVVPYAVTDNNTGVRIYGAELIIPAGAESGDIPLSILNIPNDVDEIGLTTGTLGLKTTSSAAVQYTNTITSVVSGLVSVGSVAQAVVRIIRPAPTGINVVTLPTTNYTLAEGNQFSVTLEFDNPLPRTGVVTFSLGAGAGADGAESNDFPAFTSGATAFTATLTPNAENGAKLATFSVTIPADQRIENTEFARVAINRIDWVDASGVAHHFDVSGASADFAILDDEPSDAVSVSFDPAEPSSSENAGTAQFALVATPAVGYTLERDMSVRIASSDGSAGAGSDYTAIDQTITFTGGPGGNKQYVSLPLLNDNVSEPVTAPATGETVGLQVYTAGDGNVSPDVGGTFTIIDDDDPFLQARGNSIPVTLREHDPVLLQRETSASFSFQEMTAGPLAIIFRFAGEGRESFSPARGADGSYSADSYKVIFAFGTTPLTATFADDPGGAYTDATVTVPASSISDGSVSVSATIIALDDSNVQNVGETNLRFFAVAAGGQTLLTDDRPDDAPGDIIFDIDDNDDEPALTSLGTLTMKARTVEALTYGDIRSTVEVNPGWTLQAIEIAEPDHLNLMGVTGSRLDGTYGNGIYTFEFNPQFIPSQSDASNDDVLIVGLEADGIVGTYSVFIRVVDQYDHRSAWEELSVVVESGPWAGLLPLDRHVTEGTTDTAHLKLFLFNMPDNSPAGTVCFTAVGTATYGTDYELSMTVPGGSAGPAPTSLDAGGAGCFNNVALGSPAAMLWDLTATANQETVTPATPEGDEEVMITITSMTFGPHIIATENPNASPPPPVTASRPLYQNLSADNNSAVITIIDRVADAQVASFGLVNPATVFFQEGDDVPISVTLNRALSVTERFSVRYQITPIPGVITVEDFDPPTLDGRFAFEGGEGPQKTFAISIAEDGNPFEGVEVVILNLVQEDASGNIILRFPGGPALPVPGTFPVTFFIAAPVAATLAAVPTAIDSLDVAPARVDEGGSTVLTVRLNAAVQGDNEAVIRYTIADARDDWATVSGAATISEGDSAAITLHTLDDLTAEGAETFKVSVSASYDGQVLGAFDETTSVTIMDDDAADPAELAAQTRALAHRSGLAQVAAMRSLASGSADGGGLSLADNPEDMDDFIQGMAFSHAGDLDTGGSYGMWMRGHREDLSGSLTAGASLAGDSTLTGVGFGMEFASADDSTRQGVAVGFTRGSLSFTSEASGESEWEERMTLVSPYMTQTTAWGDIFASAGFGQGTVSLTGDNAETGAKGSAEAESQLLFLNAGGSWAQALPLGLEAQAEGEGIIMRKTVAGHRLGLVDVPAVQADAARLDMTARLTRPTGLFGGSLEPYAGLAGTQQFADVLADEARRDIDAETGFAWARGGFTAATDVRAALLQGATSRWGIESSLGYQADESGAGWAATLTGRHDDAGLDDDAASILLREEDEADNDRKAQWDLSLETGYGVAIGGPGSDGLLTPFTRMERSGTGESLTAGARMSLGGLALEVETERGEEEAGDIDDTRARLTGGWSF